MTQKIELEATEYNRLIDAALAGDRELVERIDRSIRRRTGLRRYTLWVRWVSLRGRNVPPPDVTDWPEELKRRIVMDRAISRDDVEALIRSLDTNPIAVHVTNDPEGEIGWSELEHFQWHLQ